MSRLVNIAVFALSLVACGRVANVTPTATEVGKSSKIVEGASGRVWEQGKQYDVIAGQQSVSTGSGKVEVLEFFWYGCPHCYRLEPHLVLWNRQLRPEGVDFIRVPSTSRSSGSHAALARLFFSLKELGREDLHDAVFDTIHRLGNPLYNADEARTFQLQLEFAQSHGIAGEDFTRAYHSPSVDADLKSAAELIKRYHIQEVPTLVVNGRYLTDLEHVGRNEYDLVEVVTALVASERKGGEGTVRSASTAEKPTGPAIAAK